MRRALALLSATAFVAALAVGLVEGGGAGGRPAAPRAAPAYDGTLAGVPLQRARCRNWRAAGRRERHQAVAALAATVGAASTTGGVGTTLPDARATELLDRICDTPGTSGFALYLLYARAAAFQRTPEV